MRLFAPLTVLLCTFPLFAQTPEDAEVTRARAGIEKLRQLVAVGAAPRVELEQAEEALADAADFAFLRRTLYGTDLTESQTEAMVEAANRRLERRKLGLERAQKLVDLGVASKVSLGTFLEALDWARKELDLAESRSRFIQEATRMAEAEQNLQLAHQRQAEEASFTRPLSERFEGDGLFTAEEFQRIEKAFAAHFAKSLPVSAIGETAVHRALGFDHRGRVDVALNPDQPEGKWLRDFLAANRIPFFAFWQAVPGKATGAHIHIGPMSTRIINGG